ncbi:hypothetical protein SAMN05216246_10273 [Actinomyces denticolens]|uniref:Lipoprotein n=1 Tax=Actinomyces denticolens TaxID=52767 RepID=A0ABY1I346_9ACTO|nr:hypothetical protein [Actinomyces denticolens]SHI42499.1 hypothetical protein SAMN05216246_10273 [Actinomyces denticolens]
MHARSRGQRVVVSAVTAAAAALWIGGLSGCAPEKSDDGNTDADYVRVCKDPATGERTEDTNCPDDYGSTRSSSHSSGPHWVYAPISRGSSVSAPGVGEKVPSGYSNSKPSSSSKVTTSGRSGGSYSRGSGTSHGGFGSGSKGGSGS